MRWNGEEPYSDNYRPRLMRSLSKCLDSHSQTRGQVGRTWQYEIVREANRDQNGARGLLPRAAGMRNAIQCAAPFSLNGLLFHSHCLQITSHLDASSRDQQLEEIRRRDHHELIEMITKVFQNKNSLKIALARGTPEDARSVVEAIEQARSRISPRHAIRRFLISRTGVEGGGL